ncbi:Fur family transcriptional regulator [Endozoicomonadaceae bacterium StTr2]
MVDEATAVYESHDHKRCIHDAVTRADEVCRDKNVRLTPLRRRVFELVWQHHRPVGAYDLLAELAKEEGRNAAPPTVYRALDFLLEQGLIHRINSLNAYIGCTAPGCNHQGCFLICHRCKTTLEVDSEQLLKSIRTEAGLHDFLPQQAMVEVTGLCPNCRGAA